MRVVKAERTLHSCGVDAAFVKLHTHRPTDIFLRLGDEGLNGLALGGKPEAIVYECRVFWNERVAQVHDFAIHRERLHLAVGKVKDRSARCFINAPAFHADEAVLNHVHASHTMLAAKLVELVHHAERIQILTVD